MPYDMMSDPRAFDKLAEALSVLDENSEENKRYDAMYEEAVQENQLRDAKRAEAARLAARRDFWAQLASNIMLSHYRQAGTVAGADGDDVVVVSSGYSFSVKSVMGMWDYPHAVEVIGGYSAGRRERSSKFKRNAGGTYNFDRIAELVLVHAYRGIRQQIYSANQRTNAEAAAALIAKLRFRKYRTCVAASADTDNPIFVNIKIERSMTAEKAEQLVLFLKERGLMSASDFEE